MPGSLLRIEGLPGDISHVEVEIPRNDGNPYATLLSQLGQRFHGINRCWVQFKCQHNGRLVDCGDDAALRNALDAHQDSPLLLLAKIPLNASVTARPSAPIRSEIHAEASSPDRSSEERSDTDSEDQDLVRLSQIVVGPPAPSTTAAAPSDVDIDVKQTSDHKFFGGAAGQRQSAIQLAPRAPVSASTASDDQAHAVAAAVVDVARAIAGRYSTMPNAPFQSEEGGGVLSVVLCAVDEVVSRDTVCGPAASAAPAWLQGAVVRGLSGKSSLDAPLLLQEMLPTRVGCEAGLLMALATCGAWHVEVRGGYLCASAVDDVGGGGLVGALAQRGCAVVDFINIGDDDDVAAEADLVALLQGCGGVQSGPQVRKEAVVEAVVEYVAEGLLRPLAAILALSPSDRDAVLHGFFRGAALCVGVIFCSVVRALGWCGIEMSLGVGGGGWLLSSSLSHVAAAHPYGLLALQLLAACVMNAAGVVSSDADSPPSVVEVMRRAAIISSLPLALEPRSACGKALLALRPLEGVCDGARGGGWLEAVRSSASDATVADDLLELTEALAEGGGVDEVSRRSASAIADAVRALRARCVQLLPAADDINLPERVFEDAVVEVSVRRRRSDVVEIPVALTLTSCSIVKEQRTTVPPSPPSPPDAERGEGVSERCTQGTTETLVVHVQHSVSGRFIDDSPTLSSSCAVHRGVLVRKPRSSTRWLVHVMDPARDVVVLQTLRSKVLALDSDGRLSLRAPRGGEAGADEEERWVMVYGSGLDRRAGGGGVYVGTSPPSFPGESFLLRHYSSGTYLCSLDDGGSAVSATASLSEKGLWQFAALSSLKLVGGGAPAAAEGASGPVGGGDPSIHAMVDTTSTSNLPPPPHPSPSSCPSRDLVRAARYELNDVQLDAFKQLLEIRGGGTGGGLDDEQQSALDDEVYLLLKEHGFNIVTACEAFLSRGEGGAAQHSPTSSA